MHIACIVAVLWAVTAGAAPAPDAAGPWTLRSGDVIDISLRFAGTDTDSFRIASGDVLSVVFVNHPELTLEQRVRPDGMIAIPYTGDVPAAGLTPQALRLFLTDRLSLELNAPQIVVVLKDGGGRATELRTLMNQSGAGSRRFTLRPDGCISLPAAGDVFLAGATVAKACSLIAAAYATNGISVSADVTVSQPQGSVICVVGAVYQPGRFMLDRPMSLPEAIALAGGNKNDASIRNVFVVSTADGTARCRSFNLEHWLRGNTATAAPLLHTGDVVYVPRIGLSTAAERAREIGEIIFLRGWSLDLGSLLFGGVR